MRRAKRYEVLLVSKKTGKVVAMYTRKSCTEAQKNCKIGNRIIQKGAGWISKSVEFVYRKAV